MPRYVQFDFSFLVNLLYFSEDKKFLSSDGFFNQNMEQRDLVKNDSNTNQTFLDDKPVERNSQNSDERCSVQLFSPNFSPFSSPFDVLKAAIREANSRNL